MMRIFSRSLFLTWITSYVVSSSFVSDGPGGPDGPLSFDGPGGLDGPLSSDGPLSPDGRLSISGSEEVMILFDASQSGVLDSAVHTHLDEAWLEIRKEFPNARFAVSSFVDKPAPFVGLGVFGGYPNGRRIDWCYRLESSLTYDDEISKLSLKSIPYGSGLDSPEGHFEAIIRSVIDKNVGWTEESNKYIIIFTDDFGHVGTLNNLKSHVDLFNRVVHCDPKEKYSMGGFGAQSTYNELAGWVTFDYDIDNIPYSAYYEMANLLYQHMCEKQELNLDDFNRLEELRTKLGPIEVPNVKDFDLNIMINDPDKHCREYEYPNFEHVVEILKNNNFKLIIIQVDSINQTNKNNVQDTWIYTLNNYLKEIPNQYRHIFLSSPKSISTAVIDTIKSL